MAGRGGAAQGSRAVGAAGRRGGVPAGAAVNTLGLAPALVEAHEAVVLLTPSPVVQLSVDGPRVIVRGTRITLTVKNAAQCCGRAPTPTLASTMSNESACTLHFGNEQYAVDPSSGKVSFVLPANTPTGPYVVTASTMTSSGTGLAGAVPQSSATSICLSSPRGRLEVQSAC